MLEWDLVRYEDKSLMLKHGKALKQEEESKQDKPISERIESSVIKDLVDNFTDSRIRRFKVSPSNYFWTFGG